MTETDRIQRAGHYVSGLLSEPERARAERDLKRDASFREAVRTVSQRMRAIDEVPLHRYQSESSWAGISARLSQLPHLKDSGIRQDNRPGVMRIIPKPASTRFITRHRDRIRLAGLAGCLAMVFVAGYFAGSRSPMDAPTMALVDLNK